MASTDGSIGVVIKLNHNEADIVINLASGLHHLNKSEVSRFLMQFLMPALNGTLTARLPVRHAHVCGL